MNTNGGFPELYVVLDALLNGESAGQAYQRLLNQMIKEEKLPIDRYVMTDNDKNIAPRNKLLEILIGDAAAVPFAGEGRSVRK
jgi:antitoxin component of RelBE/YafQ-DinJ toxin-antitoxin module